MIIDIHSHILPGIDDGARNMDEAIEMLEIAAQEGIGGIVVTPHYEAGIRTEQRERYREVYGALETYISARALPIKLYPGNEVYYSESIVELLQSEEVCTMNQTRYVLVEFSVNAGYQTIERALNNLLYSGYWPIIAHVERYSVLRNVKKVFALVKSGVYIQANASAIIGKEGWNTKYFCRKLLNRGLIHFVATDAHRSDRRRPAIKKCLEYIEKKYGKVCREQISEKNPLKVLKGERISGKN